MKVYIVKVAINDKQKHNYIDSVWENLQDARQHIEVCQEKNIFNDNFKAEIQAEEVYKHIQ